jgi:succinoglycan biosynthesis protein ExoM
MNDQSLGCSVSVCIPTFKRVDRLELLLDDIAQQTYPCNEIVVVDNDADGSAKALIEQFRQKVCTSHPMLSIKYEIQPIKNISITRNRTIALATGEWLAIVDDDERAPKDWVELLLQAAKKYSADAIIAPVVPVVPDYAVGWIRRGNFYETPRSATTGQQVPRDHYRFGNILLRAAVLRNEPGPFDPAYGNTGGEDGDLLCRLELKGIKLVWSDEAIVKEPVEQKRLSANWLWMRAMRGGQDLARHILKGRYGSIGFFGKAAFSCRAFAQLIAAAILAVIVLPLGRHQSMKWVIKVAANFGKLSYFWGWHYREYA